MNNTSVVPNDFLELCNKLRSEIKELIKKESKIIKSISFSQSEEKREFVIFFTWLKEGYEENYQERDILRNCVKSLVTSNNFAFNLKKSTPAKYIFKLKTWES